VRLVQLALPPDSRSAILEVLDDEGIDYVLLAGENETIVQFPLPAQAVEPVLSDLREAGYDDRYRVVSNVESARASTSTNSNPGSSRAARPTSPSSPTSCPRKPTG
jgi:hypothetical protein